MKAYLVKEACGLLAKRTSLQAKLESIKTLRGKGKKYILCEYHAELMCNTYYTGNGLVPVLYDVCADSVIEATEVVIQRDINCCEKRLLELGVQW